MPLTLTKETKLIIMSALQHAGVIEQLSAWYSECEYQKILEAERWIREQEEGAVPLSVIHERMNVVMDLFREEEMEDDDFESSD